MSSSKIAEDNDKSVRDARAIVVVLGDIGHSPRMCYHASALASHNVHVDLVGYVESTPHAEIVDDKNIRLVPLFAPPRILNRAPKPIRFAFKFFILLFSLFFTLCFKTKLRANILVLQNPPGIPSMLMCYMVSWLKGASFIIDWHNYTYSMLEQSLRETGDSKSDSILTRCVRLAHWWEGYFGKRAAWNICVSNSMHHDLVQRWGIRAITVHDKPPHWNLTSSSNKKQCSTQEKHEFYRHLFMTPSFASFAPSDEDLRDDATMFTTRNENNKVVARPDRPLLVVSSTSWTEDEDFGILLDALVEYDTKAEARKGEESALPLPRLFVVITGKGPQRDYYMKRVDELAFAHVDVISAWLSAEDYPRLLASADLGVSLHTSTSGLDLPMKIVDMQAASLPVFAKRFQAIGEQIKDNLNGRLFDTPADLCRCLLNCAVSFPQNEALKKLKANVRAAPRTSWHDQYDAIVWPIVKSILSPNTASQKIE